jgi:hypothetical protein
VKARIPMGRSMEEGHPIWSKPSCLYSLGKLPPWMVVEPHLEQTKYLQQIFDFSNAFVQIRLW